MPDTFEIDMDRHFAAAGIPAEEAKVDEQQAVQDHQQNTQQQQSQDQSDADKEKSVSDTIVERLTGEQSSKKADSQDQQQKPDDQNKQGSGTDNGNQQGKKEEGQAAVGPGDLTLQDGTIIKAGQERRWYNESQAYKTQVGTLNTQLHNERQSHNSAKEKLAKYEDAAKAVGVADPTEMSQSLRLYRDLREKPVETIKQLLAELKAVGHNIEGIGSSVDTAAISRMLDQRLGDAKLTEGRQQQELSEQDQRVAEEVTTFLTTYPDAAMHEAHIAALIEANPGTSLVDAYIALKNGAEARGFNWAQPLSPQIEAAKQSDQTQQQTQQQQSNIKPLTQGTNISGHSQGKVEVIPHLQANSIEDAIRASLAEHGIK